MELKDFVESVLIQLDLAVTGARKVTSRDIAFSDGKNIDFDIAVSVESTDKSSVDGKIRVFEILRGGAESSNEDKSRTLSRIKFTLQVEGLTKTEVEADRSSRQFSKPSIKRFD